MVKKAVDQKKSDIVSLLNQILSLEYSIIIHFPRLYNAFPNKEMADKVLYLSTASIKHANGVAEAIEKLGGKPEWRFEPFPDDDLIKIFEIQMSKERQAHDMHARCSEMADDSSLKKQFATFSSEETQHEKVARELYDYLCSKPQIGPR